MKTNAKTKKTAGRKLLVLALAFMMVMQFNFMALSTAWADTEEIAQEEQIEVKEAVKEEVKTEAKAPAQTEIKTEVKEEVKEVKQEAPQTEVKEEVKQEAPAEAVKQEAAQEEKAAQPKEEIKAEVKNELPAEALKEEVKMEVLPVEMEKALVEEEAKEAEAVAEIEEEEEIAGPALSEAADNKLTVHITNILYINKTRPESSVNGKAVPWTYEFTISKNGTKSIAHNGTYSYVGGATASGSTADYTFKFLKGFVLASRKSGVVTGDSLDGFKTIQKIANTKGESVTVTFTDGSTKVFTDADIYISPVYSIKRFWHMDYRYIDLVSTGSGSWYNEGAASSFTKKYTDPSVKTPVSHYQFISWFNTDKKEYFKAGESDKYTNDMFKDGEIRKVEVYALWQPSVTVNYSVLGTTAKSTENFKSVNVYDYIPANPAANVEFEGWYDAAGNRLDENAAYNAPEITGLGVKADPAVYTVNARFTTSHTVSKVWDDQNREDSLRADSIEAALMANGSETSSTVTLNEENGWSHTYTGLNAYDEHHHLISYTADETSVIEGYTKVVDLAADAVSTVITNIFMPEITITAGSGSWTFDGEEHHNANAEITEGFLYDGDRLEASASGTVLNVEDTAEGNNVVSEYRIMRGEGEDAQDVTALYRIHLQAGTLEITPAPVIEEPADDIEEPAAPVHDDKDDNKKAPAAGGNHSSHKPETVSGTTAMTDTATGHTVNEIETAEAPAAAPAEMTEMIEEEAAPLAVSGAWALINLLSAILSAIISLALLITYFTRRDEDSFEAVPQAAEGGDHEHKEWNRKGLLRILSIVPAVASIILFILTEDMSQPMVLTDNWTILMVVILLITAAMAILSKKTEKEEDEEAQA